MFLQLWRDESGAIVSSEIVVVMTTLVIGLIAGGVALQNAITEEMGDVGRAMQAFNQSFSFGGKRLGEEEAPCAEVLGSLYADCPETSAILYTCIDNAADESCEVWD